VYEKTLQTAERLLAVRPSSPVPVRDLWQSVCKEAQAGKIEPCTLPDFAALLEADPRFEFFQKDFSDEELDARPESDGDNELKSLGFLTESTVRLKSARSVRDVDEEEEIPSISFRHLSETAPSRMVGQKKPISQKGPKKSAPVHRSSRKRRTPRKR